MAAQACMTEWNIEAPQRHSQFYLVDICMEGQEAGLERQSKISFILTMLRMQSPGGKRCLPAKRNQTH